jgi:membrane-bound serine protease (ClpP class)
MVLTPIQAVQVLSADLFDQARLAARFGRGGAMLDAVISIDITGALLIVLGLILVASELSAPSHGGIASLGFLSIFAGVVVLIVPEAAVVVSAPVLFIGTAAFLGIAIIAFGLAVSVRRRKIVTGYEAMLDATGSVLSWNGSNGHIFIHGERWRATGPPQAVHDTVRVVGVEGLTLRIETAAGNKSAEGFNRLDGE